MASNDCSDNYLFECNNINYSYGFKFQKYYYSNINGEKNEGVY